MNTSSTPSQAPQDDAQKFIKIILTNTYTKSDAIRRIRVLRIILENKFFAQGKNIDQKLLTLQISPQDTKAVKDWLAAGSIKITPGNVYKYLKRISEDIDRIPNIVFYIASAITDPRHLAKITTWVRTYIAEDSLLEFKVDPKKVGGLAFVQKGLLQDYSLEYFMKQNRKSILGMIGSYGQR